MQIERGLETGEFCPEVFDYVLVLRHPLERMNSMISNEAHNKGSSVNQVLAELRKGRYARRWLGWDYGHEMYAPVAEKRPSWNKCSRAANSNPVVYLPGCGEGLVHFDNLLVRTISANSTIYHSPLGTITDAHFQQAVANLRKFGLITKLGPAAEVFKPPLRWSKWSTTKINHHTSRNHTISQTQKDQLSELNTYDLKIWEMIERGQLAGRQGAVRL